MKELPDNAKRAMKILEKAIESATPLFAPMTEKEKLAVRIRYAKTLSEICGLQVPPDNVEIKD